MVSRRFAYDAYGNQTTAWDANGNPTQTTYDGTYHTFPTQVTNARQQTTTTDYDDVLGKPVLVTDPNNAVTRFEYDTFGRVTRTWLPTEDIASADAATFVYTYDTTSVPNRVTVGARQDAGGGAARRRYRHVFYDGLGREVQRQEDVAPAAAGGTYIRAADSTELRAVVNGHLERNR